MSKKAKAPYTKIIRNGSHGPDEPPASIDELIALLETNPVASWTTCRPLKEALDATFLCGEFRSREHPFSIVTTDPAIKRRLTEAFLANCDRFQVEANEPRSPRSRARAKNERRRR
ncbi:MAG: hypothetical protein ACJ8AT_23920 [Hyalangium sp.]|uniref:hypothetical protein n=1 Tax=Hyalangium sp. TaxID=2028555 RepID=UPI00389A46EF